MAVMSKSAKSGASLLPRVIDLLLYIVIAVAVIGSVYAYAVYQAKARQHARLPLKWMGFGALTLVVFGYTLRDYRRFWGRRLFWVVFCVSLLVHLGLGLVLRQFDTVPLVLFAVAGWMEAVVLETLMAAVLRE